MGSSRTPPDSALVSSLPKTTYYIPNFISPSEESQLLSQIASAPKPKWTILTHRRLQTWPSALSKSNILLAEPLPSWLELPIIPRMQELGIWDNSPHKQPNHVLVNEYKPGEGIMAHEDGPAYHPMVATVSLGAPIVLEVFEKSEDGLGEAKFRILQEPRSLLVTTDDMYTTHLHGIAQQTVDENIGPETVANWDLLGEKDLFADGRYDRQIRTSLTYRDVLKVAKFNLGNSLFKR
ncbi:uncharacterized protein H6S33_003093 [Morchella sextelata]|uniref:uncharacterized protein n=1 Tax=Morchella sextelata TaxID=1174677 RepID=UPI001D04D3E4|nr:uncharacterized protein H6S33_003093 [Morchella sextelata]KAH0607105.1 hypothetical protein H6S33_003093 [Morchella sextelata]